MSNNRTHKVQRTTEYDSTPTYVARVGELIVVPRWMADVLRRVDLSMKDARS